MAAGIGPERGSAAHQSRQHLVAQAARSDAALLAAVRRQVPPAPGSVAARIVDDTGFPERGEHSVGVTRQYRGGLGRLLSLAVAGAPTPPHLAGLAMELVVVPLLVLWQGRVARSWDRTG